MKSALRVIAVVVVVVVILVALVLVYLDTVIRKGVETAGSYALGVKVELAGADLSLLGGQLTLSDLKVSNPEGFKTDRFFEMGTASIKLRPSSLLGEELIIETIVLESPSLTIEQSGRGTNMAALLANIQGEGREEEKPEKEERPKEEKSYRIGKLEINGAKVTFSSLLTAGAPVTVPLPDIEMEDLSSDDGKGLKLAEVFDKVFGEMIQTAITEGRGVIPTDMMKDIVSDLGSVVPGLAAGVVETSKGITEKATEALKGLFDR